MYRMNIFKNISAAIRRRRSRKQLIHWSRLLSIYHKMTDAGLLTWNPRERMVYISQELAAFYIKLGHRQWCNFLTNIYNAHIYVVQSEKWDMEVSKRVGIEMQKYIDEHPHHTAADVERARQLALSLVNIDDIPVPELLPMSFCIIYNDHTNNPEITVVGEYDPTTNHLDMAEWQKIYPSIKSRILAQK